MPRPTWSRAMTRASAIQSLEVTRGVAVERVCIRQTRVGRTAGAFLNRVSTSCVANSAFEATPAASLDYGGTTSGAFLGCEPLACAEIPARQKTFPALLDYARGGGEIPTPAHAAAAPARAVTLVAIPAPRTT